jgi:hypothetical protein
MNQGPVVDRHDACGPGRWVYVPPIDAQKLLRETSQRQAIKRGHYQT